MPNRALVHFIYREIKPLEPVNITSPIFYWDEEIVGSVLSGL